MRLIISSALVLLSSVVQAEESRGLSWKVPAGWSVQAARPIRTATYTTPKVTGDVDSPECAVFSFERGLGGGVEQNVDLWMRQFDDDVTPTMPKLLTRGALQVTTVELDGTMRINASDGPVRRREWKLLGAIIEGPRGRMFFKLMGPKKSVEAARDAFVRMVHTVEG